jgi:hypothetical protein
MAEPLGTLSAGKAFERNDSLVVEAFHRGEFDFLEGVSEISETDFFRAIAEKKVLEKLAATYPSPCKKHDVPLWVYIAGDISMRFNGIHQFHAFPYVVRSGGLVNAFGPAMGHKVTHPQTGDVTLCCEGFNNKNEYDRQTPCDQDYLRKMAKKTDADLLMKWFNHSVVGIFKQHHAFDPEGIFIGDASYLFVPDNDKYEGSSRMLFDEHNHPVDSQKVSPKQRADYTWRRCYKMISLIHTNRKGAFFLYGGIVVTAGKDHECPILYDMVEKFVGYHGKGTIKKLILDRGFIDGPNIGRCKQEWGIDVLIPARKDMDIYQDVVDLAKAGRLEFKPWMPPAPFEKPIPLHRPEHIRKREETRQRTLAARKALSAGKQVKAAKGIKTPPQAPLRSEVAVIADLETFTTCPVPLTAVVNKEFRADGSEDYWVLLSTGPISDPAFGRQEYALRTTIEERHRQLKCFSDLEAFTSRSFSLIVNQVVFVLLTYSLMQWYLLRIGRGELNTKTRTRTLELLRPAITMILIYYKGYVAYLSPLEHQELVLTLNEKARQKILAKTRKLRRSLANQLTRPRAP